jgi:hypothetical protein
MTKKEGKGKRRNDKRKKRGGEEEKKEMQVRWMASEQRTEGDGGEAA